MKAPFSWPNSSVSSRFAGIAAQLMLTKGPSARLLATCCMRANLSLPVPDSPSSSTVVLVEATCNVWWMDWCSAGLWPMMP